MQNENQNMEQKSPRIIAISDTHNFHNCLVIPECDILIHCGDASGRGSMEELIPFLNWFSKQPSKYKVFVPGNHDWGFENMSDHYRNECSERGITLLMDEMVELEGLKIWGSPVQPFYNYWAFNRERGSDIKRHWDLIPKGLDILITHGPPYGFLDENALYQRCGCEDLLYKILEVRPKAHIFGHIHNGYGQKSFDGIKFYNASSCDDRYKCVNAPLEILL